MVTQKEIALSLGVSRETVKFALNGNGKLSPATRERVLREAERLGYSVTANMNARTLAAKRNGGSVRTYAIGVLCSKTADGRSHHATPYFLPFWEGIEEEAEKRGYEVALYLHREGQLPRLLRDGDVDGVVLLTPAGDSIMQEISKPVVALGSRNLEAHNVLPDGPEGMRLAVQHLVQLGHRRIAYLGGAPIFYEGASRLEGIEAALKAAGCLDRDLIEATVGGASRKVALDGIRRLLARTRDFTGLVCYNDTLAMAAIDAMAESGIKVPEDVSVVGFDNIVPASPLGPGLTSISFDAHAMGRKAVEIIALGDEEGRTTEIFPVKLEQRASSGPVPR